jgi:acyl-coenzyme A thioesterase PaaI-like protein
VGERVTTTDLTIHYLRPATTGRMTATARIVRGGRRLFVLSVDVHDDPRALIATAVTTYIKIERNPSESSTNSREITIDNIVGKMPE